MLPFFITQVQLAQTALRDATLIDEHTKGHFARFSTHKHWIAATGVELPQFSAASAK
jgi:hypothetical protein